ncbi:MAG: type II secretion system F family protein [Nitrospinae bacterium]|nr:type II secretion system F family protein [Nitrospinota bacterium]
MLYAFEGVDSAGKPVSGSIDAAGAREARTKLRSGNIFVTSLAEEEKAEKAGRRLFPFLAGRVSQKEMTSFMRQVASLVSAGIPLMETLEAAQKQCESAHLKKVLNELKNNVRQGETLADAMQKASAQFDPLTVAMVRAGETGGHLADVLNQVADLKENTLRRDNALQSAMIYPVVMAVIGMGVIIFLLGYVVPKITVIFEDMGHTLPLATKILIFVTGIIVDYWFVLGLLLVGALTGAGRYIKTEKGKANLDRLLLRPPVVGPLLRAAILARWSHAASALLQSGVPLLKTLHLTAGIAQNTVYAEAIEKAAAQIREGAGIAESLAPSALFPPVALQMVAAGEKSGQSAKLLMQVARDQGAELENRITVLMSLVQPALIIVMGLIVGFIVMAILLPIFEISQLIG